MDPIFTSQEIKPLKAVAQVRSMMVGSGSGVGFAVPFNLEHDRALYVQRIDQSVSRDLSRGTDHR
ncbi:MAG TPA: hypothetical protein VJN19_01475 [Propionibacteriaceae bacterium]|nr:hypothetical protein [Propionibacteriaceae bacterium]